VGQKIHPGGLRVGIIHGWKSNWYTGTKEFPAYLIEDVKIRDHITGKLGHAGLSDILIRKDKQRITIDIYTARPGIVIGKSGAEVDALRREIHAMTQKNVHININEIKRPELDAKLVAQSIAEQLQNRVSFRRAMKRSLASAMRSGAQGVRVQCGGRLGGGEMSRSESYSEGRVPLHTLRADIDYGFAEAKTTFGRIGVKVWINKGEIMPEGYGEAGDGETSRRRTNLEGLSAGREGGRRAPDREGLGPVRKRGSGRRGGGGGGGRRGPGGPGGQAERPRTDARGVSAEGRKQPEVTPEVPEVPKPIAEAPDVTTPKKMHEDPTKLEQSGDPSAEKPKRPGRKTSPKKTETGERAAKAPEAATARRAAKAEPEVGTAEAAADASAEEKPKATRSKAASKPKATKADAGEAPAEEKPKRAPRTKNDEGGDA
jgi:small subunit ribosomal protein S3